MASSGGNSNAVAMATSGGNSDLAATASSSGNSDLAATASSNGNSDPAATAGSDENSDPAATAGSDGNPDSMDASATKARDIVSIEDRKKEVDRILKCQTGDWYNILDVERNCNPLVARRAAIKSLFLIKDRFETEPGDWKDKSHEATKLVSEAAEQLKAGSKYVEVDKDGNAAKPPPQSEPYAPSQAMKAIYKLATDSVLMLFSGVADTSLAELEIHLSNEDIRDTVLKDNRDATILDQISGFIDLKTIMSYIELRKQHEAVIAKRPDKHKLATSTKSLGQMGSVIDEFNARKGYPSGWNWDKQKNPELWTSKPPATTHQEDTVYPPGQTKDGDNILGYLPVYKLDFKGGQYVDRCEFIIEDDDTMGSMRLASWQEIGREAGQAYLDQPEEDKLLVPNSEVRYNTPMKKMKYQSLIGFWTANPRSESNWGRSYCWIDLGEDGYDIVSKTCFEKLSESKHGRKGAGIAEIYELFGNDPDNYYWRTLPVGKQRNATREGPFGQVEVQRRKMIDNGPQLGQQPATGDVDNLAKVLEGLSLEAANHKAQMEAQNKYISDMFTHFTEEIRKANET